MHRHRLELKSLSVLALGTFLGACDRSDQVVTEPTEPTAAPATADFDSGSAVQWLDLVYRAIQTESLSPPVAARAIGYTGVAFYEAVVAGMPDHQSLGDQLNQLGALPAPPPGDIHWPSAANAASAAAMNGILPGASQPTADMIAQLEADLRDEYRAGISAELADRSEDYGAAIAAAVLAWASTDGYDEWNNCAFIPPVGDGLWVPTPPGFAPPLQPCWGNMRPFAMLFSAECPPLPHPPFSWEVGSAFYNETLEVYDTVNNLTDEQREIAQFWADNPGATGTPPGHWVSVLEQILVQEEGDLAMAAEAYAKVGIAVADAFICCWEMKFFYNLMRPITYIRDATGPINDPAWVTAPGVGTPPFPEFTSGHSVQSGAATFMLTDVFGNVAFVDHTHDDTDLGMGIVLEPRAFSDFYEAAEEAAISRLYGGIHYRAAIDNGVDQGRCIGATILDNVRFEK